MIVFTDGDLVRDKHLYGTDGKKAFGVIVKFHRRHRDYDWGCCYEVYFVNRTTSAPNGTTNRRPSYLEKINV